MQAMKTMQESKNVKDLICHCKDNKYLCDIIINNKPEDCSEIEKRAIEIFMNHGLTLAKSIVKESTINVSDKYIFALASLVLESFVETVLEDD
jgi:hypothetical protein